MEDNRFSRPVGWDYREEEDDDLIMVIAYERRKEAFTKVINDMKELINDKQIDDDTDTDSN